MRMKMKLAALTLAAAAIVGSSAATASARSGGLDSLFGFGSSQHNDCSTSSGTIVNTSVGAATGDLSFTTDCINFDETGRANQSNDCDTFGGITTVLSGTAPTGKIDVNTTCANISRNPWVNRER